MILMPFGKYKNRPLTEIPTNYMQWVLRNCVNLDPDLKDAILAESTRRPGINKKPTDRRKQYQAAHRQPATAPIYEVMNRTLSVLVAGERDGAFHGPLLDELWELIAATHAEIRLREFPVEAWRLNLELLTKRSEN